MLHSYYSLILLCLMFSFVYVSLSVYSSVVVAHHALRVSSLVDDS